MHPGFRWPSHGSLHCCSKGRTGVRGGGAQYMVLGTSVLLFPRRRWGPPMISAASSTQVQLEQDCQRGEVSILQSRGHPSRDAECSQLSRRASAHGRSKHLLLPQVAVHLPCPDWRPHFFGSWIYSCTPLRCEIWCSPCSHIGLAPALPTVVDRITRPSRTVKDASEAYSRRNFLP